MSLRNNGIVKSGNVDRNIFEIRNQCKTHSPYLNDFPPPHSNHPIPPNDSLLPATPRPLITHTPAHPVDNALDPNDLPQPHSPVPRPFTTTKPPRHTPHTHRTVTSTHLYTPPVVTTLPLPDPRTSSHSQGDFPLIVPRNSGQAEDRRPKTEHRRPKTEDLKPKTEGRTLGSEDRRPKAEDRRPTTEAIRPTTEDRRAKT